MPISATATYTAHVTPSEKSVEVTISRYIPAAGICGPFDSLTMGPSATMGQVSEALIARGYEAVDLDSWAVRVNSYNGLTLTAELTRH